MLEGWPLRYTYLYGIHVYSLASLKDLSRKRFKDTVYPWARTSMEPMGKFNKSTCGFMCPFGSFSFCKYSFSIVVAPRTPEAYRPESLTAEACFFRNSILRLAEAPYPTKPRHPKPQTPKLWVLPPLSNSCIICII